MPADLWYLDTIRASARAPQSADPDKLRAALVALGNACREANRRLGTVAGMLDRGLPSQAIAYAQQAPSLPELAGYLDAARTESQPLFAQLGLPFPENLHLQVLTQLKRSSTGRPPPANPIGPTQPVAERTRQPATLTSRQPQRENPPGPPPLPPLQPARSSQSKGPPPLPVSNQLGPVWLLPAAAVLFLLLVMVSFGGVGGYFWYQSSKGEQVAEHAPGASTTAEPTAEPTAETPAETPVETPVETPAETPAETPSQVPKVVEPKEVEPKDVLATDFKAAIPDVPLEKVDVFLWQPKIANPNQQEDEPNLQIHPGKDGNKELRNNLGKVLITLSPTGAGFTLTPSPWLLEPHNQTGKWARLLRHSVLVMQSKEPPHPQGDITFRKPDPGKPGKLDENYKWKCTFEIPTPETEVWMQILKQQPFCIHPDPKPSDTTLITYAAADGTFNILLQWNVNYNRPDKTLTVTGEPLVAFEDKDANFQTRELNLEDIKDWITGLDRLEKLLAECPQKGIKLPAGKSQQDKLEFLNTTMKGTWKNAYQQLNPRWQQTDFQDVPDLINGLPTMVLTPEGAQRQQAFKNDFNGFKRRLTQVTKHLKHVPTLEITSAEINQQLQTSFDYEFFLPLESNNKNAGSPPQTTLKNFASP